MMGDKIAIGNDSISKNNREQFSFSSYPDSFELDLKRGSIYNIAKKTKEVPTTEPKKNDNTSHGISWFDSLSVKKDSPLDNFIKLLDELFD